MQIQGPLHGDYNEFAFLIQGPLHGGAVGEEQGDCGHRTVHRGG